MSEAIENSPSGLASWLSSIARWGTSGERERSYLNLINGLPQMLWTSDAEGQWDFLNQRWTEYTGEDLQKELGSGWLHLVHPDDRDRVVEALRYARANEKNAAVDLRIRRFDGVYRWFESRVMPLRDTAGAVVKWLGSNFDIEERVEAEESLRSTEEALRTSNDSLEQRVRDRTNELEARSEQLRALALDLAETESRERKRLARLLHDHFQQLISAARMKLGIIRRRAQASGEIESLRQTEALLEEAMNASRLLATELSPPVLQDAGLPAALEWLARRMEESHNLSVKLNVKDCQNPDNEQVRTIVFECVRELLFNVVKHGGVKTVELTATSLPEGLLEVSVADRGVGFDAARTDLKRKPDGSFGLFSMRERLSLIGGLAKINSAPGRGTTVKITVPAAFRPLEAAHIAPPETARAHVENTVRVLVADDHKIFREGLISLLNQEPYVNVVGQAGDGQEAIELARQLRPDILILDVTMPKLNGIQVASTLARELPGIKIIGLSMHERDDMAKAMCSAGAIAYCAKSAPIESLVSVLRGAASAGQMALP